MQINYGSIETISVTVRDTTSLISSLVASEPHYSVYAVDPDTDLDSTLMLDAVDGTASGMTVNCIIETEWGLKQGRDGQGVADNPPTFTWPHTVTLGVNDQFLISTIFFGMQIIAPGVYNTIEDYAAAMSNAIGQFNYGYSYTYSLDSSLGDFVWDTTLERMRFEDSTGDPAWNGLTITNGTHDGLAGTGWTSGQILTSGAIASSSGRYQAAQPGFVRGKYRLYLEFTSGTFVVPRVGPVEFFVI